MKSARFDAAAIAARRTVSRRTFVHSAAGALVAGSTLGNRMIRAALARAPSPSDPVPIPGGTPGLGGAFHVFAPALGDPIDAEPITITDFNGFVGLAYVSGMVTRRTRSSNQVMQLPFLDSDMRFMQGVYRGVDGRVRRGTFALIWIDVYVPGPGANDVTQVDDINPGVAPSGLFWTMALPENVDVNLGKGSAVMQGTGLSLPDFGDFTNSLFGGKPTVPATVSFTMRWSGVSGRMNVVNTQDGHAGEFVLNAAQLEWSAIVGDYEFVSAPMSTSTSSFAEIGHERNGVFFSDGWSR